MNQLELKISQYLHQHPEVANSLDVSTFRFVRQVSSPDEGAGADPIGSADVDHHGQAELEKLARLWPAVQGTEALKHGCTRRAGAFYFKDATVVDITQ